MKRIALSIIIVNYKVTNQLIACLDSIKSKIKDIKFEVIVVENDPQTDLTKKLKKYSFVKYVRSKKNLGFGGGNNLGERYAKGDYLFFLNPDTQLTEGSMTVLLKVFENKKVGIVAPFLQHRNGKLFELQGLQKLTPLRAIFSLSAVNKFFPKNPIAAKYWKLGVDRSKKYEVDAVPGTAFVIRKSLFEELGGFDENFFLYFEEMDLCNRVLDLGYKLYMSPSLKVFHAWGESTKKQGNIDKIFAASRFYYFKKNYGSLVAYITTWLMDFNLKRLLFLVILVISAFMRFNKAYLSSFIPDQGWFYLSAKDLLAGQIPLVGITSSHTWLHQGPFWTYILAFGLFVNNFNPLAGNYIAAIFGVLATIMIYKIGSDFFTKELGLIAAFLYSTSPLIIINERMSYHTAPISFFTTLLLFFLLKWIRGSSISFCISLCIMSILYNFELATVVFWPVILFLLIVGFLQKKTWFNNLLNKKIIIWSLISLLIPMIPIIIYDFGHGFSQTVKFSGWLLIYSPFKSLLKEVSHDPNFVFFTNLHLTRLIFLKSSLISWMILALSLILVLISFLKKISSPIGVVFIFTIFPILIYILQRIGSGAYLPMLFTGIILAVSWFIYLIFLKNKVIGLFFLFIISFSNIYFVYSNKYFEERPFGYVYSLNNEIAASYEILNLAKNEKYNLRLKSKGRLINYSVANYEYLTWWLGKNPPSKKIVSKQIQVYKNDKIIKVSEIKK